MYQKFRAFQVDVGVFGNWVWRVSEPDHMFHVCPHLKCLHRDQSPPLKNFILPCVSCIEKLVLKKLSVVTWNGRNVVSKSEDYINIFRCGFGGAVKTGLPRAVLCTVALNPPALHFSKVCIFTTCISLSLSKNSWDMFPLTTNIQSSLLSWWKFSWARGSGLKFWNSPPIFHYPFHHLKQAC